MNLRDIGRIGSKLNKDLKLQLVHSCVLSILDNGNATYAGLNVAQLNKLQKIQNAAIRFVFGLYGKDRRLPISPYLKELHFLPVFYRIKYKISLLVFKCINNLAPNYLADMIELKVTNRYGVRVNDDYFLLTVPPTPRYSKTNSAFSYSAPSTWNCLPHELRSMSDVNAFKIALKTYYFKLAFKGSNVDYDDIELM